jgi:hypothetical protein
MLASYQVSYKSIASDLRHAARKASMLCTVIITLIHFDAALVRHNFVARLVMTAMVMLAGSEWQGKQKLLHSNAMSSSRAKWRSCSSICRISALAWLMQSSRHPPHAPFRPCASSACFIPELSAHVIVVRLQLIASALTELPIGLFWAVCQDKFRSEAYCRV